MTKFVSGKSSDESKWRLPKFQKKSTAEEAAESRRERPADIQLDDLSKEICDTFSTILAQEKDHQLPSKEALSHRAQQLIDIFVGLNDSEKEHIRSFISRYFEHKQPDNRALLRKTF